MYISIKRYILRNWRVWLQGLASLKSVGEAGRLETPAGVNVAVLRQNFFGKPQFLFLRPPTNQTRPTRIEGHFLYLKLTDDRCPPHPQNSFTATPRWVSDEITGYCSPAKLTLKTNHHIAEFLSTDQVKQPDGDILIHWDLMGPRPCNLVWWGAVPPRRACRGGPFQGLWVGGPAGVTAGRPQVGGDRRAGRRQGLPGNDPFPENLQLPNSWDTCEPELPMWKQDGRRTPQKKARTESGRKLNVPGCGNEFGSSSPRLSRGAGAPNDIRFLQIKPRSSWLCRVPFSPTLVAIKRLRLM